MPRQGLETGPPLETLLRPLGRLLRPLVRLLIRSGVTFPSMADLLREVYVDVAARDVLGDPKAQTDSRVSLLTGIHRKNVRSLRQHKAAREEIPAAVTLTSQIIARWVGMPAYCDHNGAPLALPRTAAGEAPSFETLVRSVTTDIRPRAVLDNLLDQQVVLLAPDGTIRLNTAAFIPRQGGAEQLFYFARNLHDHIAAAVANVLAPDAAPFLDRSVHYDRLPPETAAELERFAREAAMRTLIEVNRVALQLTDELKEGSENPASGHRVNLGIYLYTEDEPPGGEG